ncbi:uncharacterized protein LOC113874503 [Abrus precatorius]|uniref:Uncharacterized protein LOC113874503 n=1 Tax=Abrus precatorius TaxID=3816 RepID=A0A8B8MIH3_ABRPR|nr:uncharacterized protein LOC113874503 [Abrus precatorius]
MLNDSANIHVSVEKSFRIQQDDGFFSRLMAKETSMANTSSRVYYGGTSIAVPFMWEAQPGTPKHPSSETSLPPLTPPPSYYSNSKSNNKRRNSKVNNIFSCVLPRFSGSRKGHHVSPTSSRSSSSSSTTSSSSWSLVYPADSYSLKDKDQGNLSSLTHSTTHRSFLKPKASNGFRGCYPFGNIKNAIVRHGAV